MLKILIADSDTVSVNIVEKTLGGILKGTEQIVRVSTGSEVVRETLKFEPDLIVIEVGILGLNGIEAIRQVRKMNQTVHIIIVSTYDYFTFAREALLLKVSNYILKPINEMELQHVLKMEIENIRQERKEEKKVQKDGDFMNDMLDIVGDNFVHSFAINAINETDIKRYQQLLKLKNMGYIMSIGFGNAAMANMDVSKNRSKTMQLVKDCMGEEQSYVIGPSVFHRAVIYIGCDDNTRETKEHRQRVFHLAKKIIRSFKNVLGIDVFIGIGSIKQLNRIYISYQEALECLCYRNEGPIIHIKEHKHKKKEHQQMDDMQKKMLEALRYGKDDSNNIFCKMLEEVYDCTNAERINYIIEMIYLIQHELKMNMKIETIHIDFKAMYLELEKLGYSDQVYWAKMKYSTIMNNIRLNKTERKINVIGRAKEYIQLNYNRDISLNDIAKHLNITPQHFSKIFKEETDVNYIDFLANIRISKAKELMNNTDQTIKEICFQVGYQDPNYFSRIFKKYVGITPTEYIQEREG